MSPAIILILGGLLLGGYLVAALFFLRFWRESSDRLFAFFGAAFWLLALSWLLLSVSSPTEEARPYIYAVRLVAFLLIIGGMIDKNTR